MEKLGKYCKIISGYAFKSNDLSEGTEIPVIKIGNISNGNDVIIDSSTQYVSSDFLSIDEKYHIKKGDVLISLTGSHINQPNSMVGRSCRNFSDTEFLLNQRAGKVIPNENADKNYLYYLLNTESFKYSICNRAYGAANQANVSPSDIENIKWNFPPLPTQQKIASILSAYDNLIQNYKKQIEALQTAASELYKEWFVRFRFPGYQTARFENGIPEGWKVARVGDYVKIKSGFAFKSEWWQDEGCPVVKIKDIDNGEIVITDLDFVSEEHTKKAKSFLLNEGDLVIAMTGATIGKIGLAPKIKNLYTNQRVGKFFLPENPFETMPFLYCLFSQNSTVETILCLSGASSAQPNISPDQLESIKFFFNEDIVFQFNKKSAPFFRKILKLREQITNLTQQRDLLLPRLMSGKLEVE